MRAADAGQLPARLHRIAAAISPRTRAIIVNTPHNPSAPCGPAEMQPWPTCWRPDRRAGDRRRGLRAHGLRRARHESARAIRSWRQRAFIVSSFGKTYHVTGWKVGYVARGGADGRVPQGAPVQRVHRQHADAACPGRHMADPRTTSACRPSTSASATCSAPAWPQPLPPAAQRRHLLPVRGLLGHQRGARGLLPAAHHRVGVAAIPLSAFYRGGFEQRIVRFCFAEEGRDAHLALQRLAAL